MTVISISILESSEQLVAGLPRSIVLETNVPATIFYTTDNSNPSTNSDVYISPIVLPTSIVDFTLKVFATNGTDTSPVITSYYTTNIMHDIRLPRSGVAPPATHISNFDQYPFGSNQSNHLFDYVNNARTGVTVSSPNGGEIPFGYDANGNALTTNKPLNEYLIVYPKMDSQNKTLRVGELPKVEVIGSRTPQEYNPKESSRASKLFNPRAMVIFQDTTKDEPFRPVQINSQDFSLQRLEIINNGDDLRTGYLQTPTSSGTFLKSYLNPRTQMLTSYYRDSVTNRWIISTTPYESKSTDVGNYSSMVFGRDSGNPGKVYRWNLFLYRRLT